MMKNYYLIFVAAIMLLCVQISVNAADFVLTVTGGTGSGTYASGAVANIVADVAPSGQVFDRWVFNNGTPVLGSIYNATTSLTMPASVVAITALYMPDGPYLDDCDALVSANGTWNPAATLALNTTDMVQGTGCLENNVPAGTTSSSQFSKTFPTAINTGVSAATGVLRLRYWVENAALLGANLSIELRSGSTADINEYQWNIVKANVVNGWNNFNLRFSAIVLAAGNVPDLTAITWFRIYSSGFTAGLKAKLDGIMVLEPTLTKVDPVITWTNPADVLVNSTLGSTQLNATSNIGGTLVYNPLSGTALTVIETKPLSVTFNPANLHAFCYNTVTKTVDIKVVETLSAIDNPTESTFSMYPNPLKSGGVVNFKVDGTENYDVKIMNMNGQTVYTAKLNSSHTLNVNGILKQGVYIVSLVSNTSTRNQKLFVE